MATTKKATKKTSKPVPKTTKAKSSTKQTTRKSTPRTTKPKQISKVNSFKLERESIPFNSFKITEQTVYWIVLFAYILALSLWVLTIQINIMNIINAITATLV